MREQLLKELRNSFEEDPVNWIDILMEMANSGALDTCKGINPTNNKNHTMNDCVGIKPTTNKIKEDAIKEKTIKSEDKVKIFKDKLLNNIQKGTGILKVQTDNRKRIEQLKNEIKKIEIENNKLDEKFEEIVNEKENLILNFLEIK